MGAGIAAGPHCPRSYGLPKRSVVPGLGFRPRPCGLGRFPFGFPSEAEAPSRFPGRSIEANFDGTLSGSPPGQALPVPRETGVEPKSVACSFRSPLERTPPVSEREPMKRTSPAPFRGSIARRLRFRWTQRGKWGRFRLSHPPHASSSKRPAFQLGRRSRRSAAAALGHVRSACLFRFRKEPTSRPHSDLGRAIRFAPAQSACG